MNYENDCLGSVTGNYKTKQTYSYDNLYQLIKVEGETTYNPYRSSVPEFVSNYSQDFTFDELGLGNMTSKVSKESVRPLKKIGDNLNYRFDYIYDENFAHRLVRAGDRYYKYDSNGNIICEQDGSFESNGNDTAYHKIEQETEDVYSTDYGWGLFKEDKTGSTTSRYRRTYTWNERNQLVSSVDENYSTAYVYGQDGQRSNKYTGNSETLYFNKMWTHHTDSGNSIYGGQTSKNIYLGETRIVTKLNAGKEPTYQEEYYKQYYYHSDHLGSASMISDYKGNEYQRIEYTPYGETWVEKTQNTGLEFLPYKFTAKELDEETGLYYYGARYLDPKYSRWISTDPALGGYIPKTPIDEEAERYNQHLPGMGGVFNHINGNLYHYAANNPVKYVDPDGRETYNSKSLTEDVYKSNYQLQKQYSWDDLQKFFEDNPKGIIYRYDTFTYSKGKSKRDFPTMDMSSETVNLFLGMKATFSIVTRLRKLAAKKIARTAGKQTAKAIIIEAAESTGRTTAKNLTEQLAMEQVKSAPELGKIIPVPVNDLKHGWVTADKWVKMSQNVNGVEIHYIYSSVLNVFTDFKFK
ncbi:RHS repeat-associated core domain-containing protein [Treponema sp.]|uniref:RHS repeat-associated core domain-containing protein n=1 Tax=Treponema sp. TaxID=166 RepID=UPI00298DB6FA|nr:RHS repeat-associated core domain-containing protein [Treponema sp.]